MTTKIQVGGTRRDSRQTWETKRPLRKRVNFRAEGQDQGGFAILLYWDDAETEDGCVLWVDFKLVECQLNHDGERVVQGYGYVTQADGAAVPTDDPALAPPLAAGFMKWDGCMQVWTHTPLHWDTDEELEWFCEALAAVRAEINCVMDEAEAAEAKRRAADEVDG